MAKIVRHKAFGITEVNGEDFNFIINNDNIMIKNKQLDVFVQFKFQWYIFDVDNEIELFINDFSIEKIKALINGNILEIKRSKIFFGKCLKVEYNEEIFSIELPEGYVILK